MRGLSEKEVIASKQKFGSNELDAYKKKSFLRVFLSNFSDPIIRVLIIALIINVIFMMPSVNWFEAGGIGASILISTLVSTISEYTSDSAFERLRAQNGGVLCRALRDDKIVEIDSSELVCGDIIYLTSGDKIMADGEIIEGEIRVDEAPLTGESKEIRKPQGSKILRGSSVLQGSAIFKATSVGKSTYYGKIALDLTAETRPSPLKHRLSALAKSISIIGYIASALIAFAYLFNSFCIDTKFNTAEMLSRIQNPKFVFSQLLSALTLAVSIIVVAVPEGLPMMITVVLSSNMKKMAKSNVLVRKMVGIETSGNINLLFTDKTGTLTEGKLRVKEIITPTNERIRKISQREDSKYKKLLTLCLKYCNEATYNGKEAIGSNSTDRAICSFIKNPSCNATLLSRVPFDSSKKYSVAIASCENEVYTLFKGAPEKILNACRYYMNDNGEMIEISSCERYFKLLRELSELSYRVIAVAIKPNEKSTELKSLTFLGFVAIRDRIRKEVPNAIREVSSAGVGVIMITGDSKPTAEAIAKECGIISPYLKRKRVIDGSELSTMSDSEISDMLNEIAVISRALPSDKTRLVKIAQNKGYVVGMTGDGINDSASLKSADVGFAMGSGTDVAKESADIIISDNNLASIVNAILFGRTIFKSIRKFIVFQLTMNLGAVGISLIGPFIGIDNPVTITQMLWVNIIMDTLGALAFASEPNDRAYMREMPTRREESIISREMLNKIILNGAFVLLLSIWFLKSDTASMLLLRADERYIMSAFFAMFIFTGVFVCFTSRTSRINLMANISKNKSFITIMLSVSLLQMVFIYFGGDTFRATPLYFEDLIRVIFISFLVVLFDLLRKILYKYFKMKKHIKQKKEAWRQ